MSEDILNELESFSGWYLVIFIIVALIIFLLKSFSVINIKGNKYTQAALNPGEFIVTAFGNLFMKFMSPFINFFETIVHVLADLVNSLNNIQGIMVYQKNALLLFLNDIGETFYNQAKKMSLIVKRIAKTFSYIFAAFEDLFKSSASLGMAVITAWRASPGSVARFWCFDGDTLVRMIGVMKFSSANIPMYNYKGVIVSTSHLVKEDTWKKIGSVKDKQVVDYQKKYIYCINTENNLIISNGCTFADYNETLDPVLNSQLTNKLITSLNNKKYEKMSDFYCTGFGEETLIRMKNGDKKIKDVRIGDVLYNGKKVLGTIKNIADKACILEGMIVSPSNIVFDGEWKQVSHMNVQEVEQDYLYHICTEDYIVPTIKLNFRDYD
jgi:hypothetical protein